MRAKRVLPLVSVFLAYAGLRFGGCTERPAAGDKTTVPSVTLQVVLAQESANRGVTVHASLVITNPSPLFIQSPKLLLIPQDAGVTIQGISPRPLEPVAAYGAEHREVELKVGPAAEFANHHLLFLLQYEWKNSKTQYSSAVAAPANLQVQRQFEEEAKGLPGGTAALLYLILPIMTIFLAYEVTDSLCRGKGLKWPEFKGEYVLPAFLIAIAMNFLLAFEFHQDQSLLYATPQRLAMFLLILAGIGAVIPLLLLAGRNYAWRQYGFRETDTAYEYLRKVLARFPDGKVQWATGTAEGQWKGVELPQPDKTTALGARLYVSVNDRRREGDPDRAQLAEIVGEDGRIYQPGVLLELVEKGQVAIALRESILEGATTFNNYVKTVENFQATDRKEQPVISLIK